MKKYYESVNIIFADLTKSVLWCSFLYMAFRNIYTLYSIGAVTMNDNINMQNAPSFDEDNFDLNEYKKAAATNTQFKAQVKRNHRMVRIGRYLVMVAALVVCILLWVMVSRIAGMF